MLADAIEAHRRLHPLGERRRERQVPGPDAIAAVDAAITSRRSVRRFRPAPVERSVVADILDVARRAPSGTNMQPWKVHVLAGAAKDALCSAVAAAYDAGDARPEFHYYPRRWFEPYLGRRRRIGWDLYRLLGIGKTDRAAMHAQHRRNYAFFDAPVGLIFTIDRGLELGSWLDYGMFLENVMVAARARGLDTCPQAAWMEFPHVISRVLALPEGEQVVCGMALGLADAQAPENRLVTEREPVSMVARFTGFGE
jgi:nitroreductase